MFALASVLGAGQGGLWLHSVARNNAFSKISICFSLSRCFLFWKFLDSFRTFLDENSWLLSICHPSHLRSWFRPRLPSRRRMWNREHFHKEFTKGGSTSACWTCRQRRSVTTRWKLDLSGLFIYLFASTGFHCPHRGGKKEQAGGGAEEQNRQIERQGAKRQRQLEQKRKEYEKTHCWITVTLTYLVHEEDNWNQVDGWKNCSQIMSSDDKGWLQ